MDLTFFGLEPGTSARALIVGCTTAVMVALIMAVARRRQSYWWVPIAFIVAGWASLALGSYFAVRIFQGELEAMKTGGGGIASVRLGIWQATQPALAAAWLAVVLTLFAIVFTLMRASKELTAPAAEGRPRAVPFASLAALALAAGVTPVLLFQRAMAFVLWAIIPGHIGIDRVPQAIATRLFVTAAINACCFVILVGLVVTTVLLARRSSPSRPLFVITVCALVASLALSTFLVANLRSFSNRYHTLALTGRLPSE